MNSELHENYLEESRQLGLAAQRPQPSCLDMSNVGLDLKLKIKGEVGSFASARRIVFQSLLLMAALA